MNAVCWLILVMTCAVYCSEKDLHNVWKLGDVMKEQLRVIKHCMTSRCIGRAHNRLRNTAFHAYPSKNLENIPAKSTVVFDMASENIGHAYSPQTGIFTAPVDGAYVSHSTTLVYPGKHFATILKVNGVDKAFNHGYAGKSKEWYSSSQRFVGSLRRGDRVWLSTDGSGGLLLHKGVYSTFSGFLL